MIEVKNLHLKYPNKLILSNLQLQLPAKSWTCILGLTGCGKSSLLKLLAGLSAHGSYVANVRELAADIAYMPQDDSLLPWLNVLDNVLLGHKLTATVTPFVLETAKATIAKAGLAEHIYSLPHKLSGGMKQRVALVRTVMQNKKVVLMDEPFSALDVATRHAMQELAFKLLADKTVLLVTHDVVEALRLGSQVLFLNNPHTLTPLPMPTAPPLRSIYDAELLHCQQQIWQQLQGATAYA